MNVATGESPTSSPDVEHLIFMGHADRDSVEDGGDLLIGSSNLLIKHRDFSGVPVLPADGVAIRDSAALRGWWWGCVCHKNTSACQNPLPMPTTLSVKE